jgi:uncharacterized protein YlxW (UPF0749 family)
MAQWDKVKPLQKLEVLHIEVNQLAISVGDLQETCADLTRQAQQASAWMRDIRATLKIVAERLEAPGPR